ncbi:single-stranded DNA-binding protein [Actinomyces slackii]|uniref:Single-stranded DNA-binding protein n=1 Tax=Actinomyces slackii TaxID=52774 RepID=A0A3S4TDW7_9ACTO|nr:single-stranded DNA-binding protein [Actinomyces slackii]VEG75690.1 Helix-destabilizing protein 2 [Actinomyces slackii]
MTRQLDLTLQGVVGTHPVLSRVGDQPRPYCRFRVAVTPTYRTDKGWQDGETQWFTAKAWGRLAENITASLHKGDPVLLAGRLAQESWTSQNGTHSTNVITLQSAGHDLTRGETRFLRVRSEPRPETGQAPQETSSEPAVPSPSAPASASSPAGPGPLPVIPPPTVSPEGLGAPVAPGSPSPLPDPGLPEPPHPPEPMELASYEVADDEAEF